MKKTMITAVAVLTLTASVALAGPHGGHHARGERHGGEFGEKFAHKLNLTDAQKEQIKTIRMQTREQNASFFESMKQTKQEYRAARQANDTAKAEALKGTMEAQRTQMKQIRESERQRVLSILTPEQRTQHEQLRAERAARMEAKRGAKK